MYIVSLERVYDFEFRTDSERYDVYHEIVVILQISLSHSADVGLDCCALVNSFPRYLIKFWKSARVNDCLYM